MSSPTYIQGGKIQQGTRPVTIGDHFMHVANLAVFFFTSIISMDTVRDQVDRFNGTRSRSYGGNSNVNSETAAGGSYFGGGGNKTGSGSSGRGNNVKTFGPAASSGCTGGS